MQSYGSDRVRRGDGEQVILSTRLSKGWTARVEKTLTSAEFPGTAVLWEEQYFEVILAEPLPQGGVRYVLEPWRDHHAMRVTDRYDVGSETLRAEEHRKLLQRDKQRKRANALGMLTGHLPLAVQEKMANELGVVPRRLTMLSAAPLIILAGVPAFICFALAFGGYPLPVPFWLFLILVYLTAESVLRFNLAFLNKPIGSFPGVLAYTVYRVVTRRPAPVIKGSAVTTAPVDVSEYDRFSVREPMVTLLSPADQARAAERWGYDYRRESTGVAIMILIVSAVGVISSYRMGAVSALLVAGALALEQVVRLLAFRRGPAGSVLRFVVRPLVRKFL
jgi:hypothetical protein